MSAMPEKIEYEGFEQGPIRPPSEARSLLIRVTRNCPWNRCTFCPVYKGRRFSVRPVEHVLRDIDQVHTYLLQIEAEAGAGGALRRVERGRLQTRVGPDEAQAFQAAFNWYACGMQSVFLQDANSLILKPRDLLRILTHIRERFPRVARVTSYARSHTVARISDRDLKAMACAGLNRIHIGMESGADRVLQAVCKGATQATHIRAGLKVKAAGIELSEYVMPGLGGRALSRAHARETAEALNRINPDFIRLRTLAIPGTVPLSEASAAGTFEKCTDLMTVREILCFIENLDGITSTVRSDHILNLLQEIDGVLPRDKPTMIGVLNEFLALDPERQCLYQVGRRVGIFSRLGDLASPPRLAKAREVCDQLGVTPQNVDAVIDQLMQRFI